MKITGTALKLGIFSLVLLLFTAAIIVVFGQMRLDRTTGYSAIFSNASGLRQGQFVRDDLAQQRVRSIEQAGNRLDGRAEILKGLKTGDRVVAVGQLKLQSGAAVTISADPPPPIPAQPPRY